MLELSSRHPSARTARTRPRADGRVPGQSGRGRIPDICRSYHWHKITEERFMMDEPSGVRNDQTEASVDGAQALAFHGFDAVMGQTYVVYQRRFSLRSLHIQRARAVRWT